MDRNAAGAPVSAASEVDEFMEAMGLGQPAQPEPGQPASTAPGASLPPVESADQPATEDAGTVYADPTNLPFGVAPTSVPEPPVQQQTEPATEQPASDPDAERYRQQAAAAEAARDAYKQQVEAYNAAMQAEMVRAQQRQVEQQRAERVNQAQAVYRQLIDAGDPERAADYLRSFYDGLLLQDRQAVQAQMANMQVQSQQREEQLIAPRYAQYLVQQNGLPAEYEGILSQFDGRTQDAILPKLKAQYEAQKQQLTQQQTALDQRVRELEAQMRAGTGAFNPGGTNGAAAPTQRPRPSDPREAEVYDYLTAPVLPRQR